MPGTWQSGWVAGDLVSAVEFRKSVGAVFDTTLGADAATIDTGATIPSGYAHLEIMLYVRSALAANLDTAQVRFNNDSAANYSWQVLDAAATTVSAGESLGATSIRVGRVPANNAPANSFGSGTCEIAHYAQSINHKSLTGRTASRELATTQNMVCEVSAGVWFAAPAAINRITVFAAGGNLKAGSRMTVYVWGA